MATMTSVKPSPAPPDQEAADEPEAPAGQDEAAPLAADDAGRQTLAIVGNGPVSFRFCESLDRAGAGRYYRIVVFGEEPRPAYDRVRLTDFFAHESENRLELGSHGWYAERGIELFVGDRVTAVDRDRMTITTQSGRVVSYDRLVLATGSRAFAPPLPGIDLPGVYLYRTIADVRAIKRRMTELTDAVKPGEPKPRAAVLGGGLLGLEAARALLDAGLETHVFEMASVLMPRQLDDEAAALLREKVTALGLVVHTLARTERIEATADAPRPLALHLSGEEEPLPFDMVVVSAGIRPRDELAREAGIDVAPRGGIVVSDELRTSDPNISAIGECVVHRDTVYGLVAPGYAMAGVLARRLTQRFTPRLMRPVFRRHDLSATLKVLGVDVVTLGDYLQEESIARSVVHQSEGTYRKLIMKGDRAIGFVAVGPCEELPRITEVVLSQRKLPARDVRRFERTGQVWDSPLSQNVAEWPASAVVCSCVGVCRGTLTKACGDAPCTVAKLGEATGAGTVCGSCQPLLADLVGQPVSVASATQWKMLLTVSGVAAVAMAAVFAIPAPAPAESLQSAWYQWERTLRGDFVKQITGFTLLGLSVAAASLSIRKRWLKALFTYRTWRTVHAVIGTACIVGFVAHTGLSMGDNLNLVLAIAFLGTLAVGSIAGLTAALEMRPTSNGLLMQRLKSWKPRLTGLHIAFTWPLPVLIVFHILIFYLSSG